jgi:hypothetical protein
MFIFSEIPHRGVNKAYNGAFLPITKQSCQSLDRDVRKEILVLCQLVSLSHRLLSKIRKIKVYKTINLSFIFKAMKFDLLLCLKVKHKSQEFQKSINEICGPNWNEVSGHFGCHIERKFAAYTGHQLSFGQ